MLIDKDAAIAAIRRLEIDGPQLIWSSDAIDAVQGVESDAPHVPDVEKVIMGLKLCDDGSVPHCEVCPYADIDMGTCESRKPLMNDALALIEAQQKTLDEIDRYVRELDEAVNGK